MSWETVQNDWQRHIGHVRVIWGRITDDELQQINGRRDALLKKIQEKYHITEPEADEQVKTFERRM